MARVHSVDLNTKVIEMKSIVKKFGNFVANDHINLTVHKGEIHAILGENGAGKSTLMNVLYGLYRPTEGEIYVKGVKQEFDGPGDAIQRTENDGYAYCRFRTLCGNDNLSAEQSV